MPAPLNVNELRLSTAALPATSLSGRRCSLANVHVGCIAMAAEIFLFNRTKTQTATIMLLLKMKRSHCLFCSSVAGTEYRHLC